MRFHSRAACEWNLIFIWKHQASILKRKKLKADSEIPHFPVKKEKYIPNN